MPTKLPLNATQVFNGKWLSAYKVGNYEFFHRHNKPDAVCIIAKVDGKLLLTSQKRVPHGDKKIIELPAGLIDPNETPIDTARRELLEETGYEAEKLLLVYPDVSTSPGISTELIQFVYADNLKKVADGGGLAEENEVIETLLLTPEQIFKLKDCILDMKVFVGLYCAF
jgi:ADP-ribose pyrophosphatase